MESHSLIKVKASRKDEWKLTWDEDLVTLYDPVGNWWIEEPSPSFHRLIDMSEFYLGGKISLTSPQGKLVFQKQPAACALFQRLICDGLTHDAKFRDRFRQQSLKNIQLGLALFVVCGGLFGFYVWSIVPMADPPADHWIRWFGPLIYGFLLLTMSSALSGPWLAYHGVKQLFLLQQVERSRKK